MGLPALAQRTGAAPSRSVRMSCAHQRTRAYVREKRETSSSAWAPRRPPSRRSGTFGSHVLPRPTTLLGCTSEESGRPGSNRRDQLGRVCFGVGALGEFPHKIQVRREIRYPWRPVVTAESLWFVVHLWSGRRSMIGPLRSPQVAYPRAGDAGGRIAPTACRSPATRSATASMPPGAATR